MDPGDSVIDLDFEDVGSKQELLRSYSVNDKDNLAPSNKGDASSPNLFPGASDLSQAVASQVWISGKERARQYASIYGNIDILRPYFDVEPRTVLLRLTRTFVPLTSKSKTADFPPELYGPSMLAFTLVALLLYSMKSASHTVQDGTLIGTAMGVCFGYWFAMSAVVFFLSYISNSPLTFIQVLSLLGYALTAPCVIVLLSTIFHPVHDHLFFYLLWLILGGLTSARLATVISQQQQHSQRPAPNRDTPHRVSVVGVAVAAHMLFMLYLHFAYHPTVEAISSNTSN